MVYIFTQFCSIWHLKTGTKIKPYFFKISFFHDQSSDQLAHPRALIRNASACVRPQWIPSKRKVHREMVLNRFTKFVHGAVFPWWTQSRIQFLKLWFLAKAQNLSATWIFMLINDTSVNWRSPGSGFCADINKASSTTAHSAQSLRYLYDHLRWVHMTEEPLSGVAPLN